MRVTSDWTNEQVLRYVYTLDSGPEIVVDPEPDGAGNVRFALDVTDVPIGDHSLRVGADNGWEVTWADPFDFTRPVPLQAPSGLRLEP